jgi:hypothetical protein
VKLTLKCEHGERAVEFQDANLGSDEYTMRLIFAIQPRCPYCDPMRSAETMEGPTIEERVRGAVRA